jgi:hypothetical protein
MKLSSAEALFYTVLRNHHTHPWSSGMSEKPRLMVFLFIYLFSPALSFDVSTDVKQYISKWHGYEGLRYHDTDLYKSLLNQLLLPQLLAIYFFTCQRVSAS